MAFRMNKRIRLVLLYLILIIPTNLFAEDIKSFYAINNQNGLSSNCVLQMCQMQDGRMVIVTDCAVDIYDGHQFISAPIDTAQWVSLPAYNGATHLFTDQQDRLWMKQWTKLWCLNLRTMQWEKERKWTADDFFITADGDKWLLHGNQLESVDSNHTLSLPSDAGSLQDLISYNDSIYAFFSTGLMAVFKKDGSMAYRSKAYNNEQQAKYASTSLVIVGPDKCFYQVRTGAGGAILMSFNTKTHLWHQLLTSTKWMHTLTVTPTGMLYLTTPDGYLCINPQTEKKQLFKELRMPDGTTITTGINTVWLDRDGGIWLGTYSNGLLYTSPLSGIFDTRPLDIEVYPILSSIYLHGQPLLVGKEYEGHVLLSETPAYVNKLTFSSDQNSLAFQFTTMNYVRPRSTFYRYRIVDSNLTSFKEIEDKPWITISADSAGHLVNDNGVFYLPLVSLHPGEYRLEVMSSTNPAHWNDRLFRQITFTILPPWWQTPLAYLTYIIILFLFLTIAFYFYRRHLERKRREDLLLLKIQNLADQVNRYEHTEAKVLISEPEPFETIAPEPELTIQDKEFMLRATSLVEEHINDPSYNVERLASDLCMDRTGLYKRLTAMMQQSPVVFIRSIRLHRAADMLKDGDKTIADIAFQTGFSSTSYFSKCFQKEFGCKPSEYVGK